MWDKDYWTKYEIGSRALEKFGIYALSNYELSNTENNLLIQGSGIYGYFTCTGELYQLYQPMSGKLKFMNVINYVRGLDQLEYKSEVCFITKALKDVVCLSTMGYESIASSSENVLISGDLIEKLKLRYKVIRTLLDADEAGERAMIRYRDTYNLEPMRLDLSKDPSDSVKDHGSLIVKQAIQARL